MARTRSRVGGLVVATVIALSTLGGGDVASPPRLPAGDLHPITAT